MARDNEYDPLGTTAPIQFPNVNITTQIEGTKIKVGKCPLWGLTNAMEKKPGNDRCNRGCQLYMDEVGECAIVVLARRGSG